VPLDPRVKRFLDALAAGKPPNALETTVEERRLGLAELMKLAGPQVPVGPRRGPNLARPGRGAGDQDLYPPRRGTRAAAGLIYFHGGGLVAGTVATHDPIGRGAREFGRVPGRLRRLSSSSRTPISCRAGRRLGGGQAYRRSRPPSMVSNGNAPRHMRRLGGRHAGGGDCPDGRSNRQPAAGAAIADLPDSRLQPIDGFQTGPRKRLSGRSGPRSITISCTTRRRGRTPANPRISPLRAEDVAGLPRTLIHTRGIRSAAR